MEYQLIRSRRKSIAIVIGREGEVEVRAPQRMPAQAIERFVLEKQGWITSKRAEVMERAERRRAFRVEIGSQLPYLGREYPLQAGARAGFTGGAFLVDPAKEPKPQVIGVYRKLAREYLQQRTAFFAERMGVAPASLRISGASTRFGSCSGRNGISFTWKLVLADAELVDYVVVHELCHIRQHNHSGQFWAEVERILPDYREREKRLKQFGRSLLEQDWDTGV